MIHLSIIAAPFIKTWTTQPSSGILLIASLIISTCLGCSRGRESAFAGTPVAIQVKINPVSGGTGYQFHISDQAACVRILGVLREARTGQDHKCAEVGSFTIQYDSGKTDTVQFLPGHDPARFEFRFGGEKFEVERQRFYAALREAGFDTTKIPESEH